MNSVKCPKCGLTNFATTAICKRCKQPFAQSARQDTMVTGDPGSIGKEGSAKNNDLNATVRRDGSLLVMREDDVLPMRCIMCNAPAQEQMELKVEWVPRYVYVVGLVIVAVGVVLYLLQRKQVTIYVSLCHTHLTRRRKGAMIGGSLIGLALLIGFIVALNEDYMLIPIAVIAAIVGAFVIVLLRRIVSAYKIEDSYVWLKGASKEFLNSLRPSPM